MDVVVVWASRYGSASVQKSRSVSRDCTDVALRNVMELYHLNSLFCAVASRNLTLYVFQATRNINNDY
jgi:hypothetical protein